MAHSTYRFERKLELPLTFWNQDLELSVLLHHSGWKSGF